MLPLNHFKFSIFGLSNLLVACAVLLLGLVSLFRTRFSFLAITLFLLTFTISSWLLSFIFLYISKSEALAFWWANVGYLFVPVISPAAYLFIASFLGIVNQRKFYLILFFSLGVFFTISQFYFHAIFSELYQYQWGYYPKFEWRFYPKFNSGFSLIFLFFFFSVMILCFVELWNEYKKIRHTHKMQKIKQIKLVGFAFLTGYIGSIDFIPCFGIDIYPLGVMFIGFFIAILCYVIEKYHLLDSPTFVANQIIETINDALIVCDHEGLIRIANPAVISLSQYRQEELIDRSINSLLLIHSYDNEHENFFQLIVNEKFIQGLEISMARKNNSDIPVAISCSHIVGINNKTKGWVIVVRDISEIKKNIAQLIYLSSHDYLTGIYNRKKFEDELAYHIRLSNRTHQCNAFLLLDIDHFKEINDNFGHQHGDKLLICFADFLKKYFRQTDVVGRFGGDEFAVIVTNIQPQDINELATQLIKTIRNFPFSVNGQTITVTVSIGIALFPKANEDKLDLLMHADLALYQCKVKNRNAYEIYDPTVNWNFLFKNKVQLANMIKEAMNEGRLILFSQPIFNVHQDKVSHYELLLRMKNKDKIILPENFLDVAEHYGLMREINLFVIKTTIALLEKYHDLYLTCNISSNALNDEQIYHVLIESIKEKKFAPERLILEINEHIVVTHIKSAINFMKSCRNLGVKFALDDFGVGLSSFTHLKYMPVDFLKIDGSFIKNILKNEIDRQFVKSMVEIAKTLKIKTIAEYVEDEETVHLLRQLGVDYAQGFYFGRPEYKFKLID